MLSSWSKTWKIPLLVFNDFLKHFRLSCKISKSIPSVSTLYYIFSNRISLTQWLYHFKPKAIKQMQDGNWISKVCSHHIQIYGIPFSHAH